MEYCQDISYKTFSTNNGFVGSQAYKYGGDQPHAVTGVTSAEGNISPSQCAVTYNKFNRPASISEGDYTLSLTCQSSPTLDLAILKKNGTAVCTTLYISSISECEKTAYTTRYIDYIYAGAIPVAVHVKNVFLQTDSIYYVQTDLLGSWERIVDADKQVVQASHFDPWGNRMKATQWHVADTARSFPFRRGFTGHEHYDRFRIINTGARLYDPVIARFFSPDPYVQDPFSTQSFNRYSYCWNNPIIYTDPKGEFALLTGIVIGVIASIAAGMINVAVHASNGTLNSIGDGLAYLGTGMLGGILRMGSLAAYTGVAGISPLWTFISTAYISGNVTSTVNTTAAIFTHPQNGIRVFAGQFYYDEQKWHGLSQSLTRYTRESIQQWAGYNMAQIRTIFGWVDRVDYLGGATFVTNENDEHNWGGATMGGFINMDINGKINGQFKDYITSYRKDNLFMHEYGHSIDSQTWGWLYMLCIAAPSGLNQVYANIADDQEIHNKFYTERIANSWAKTYFHHFYNVEWGHDDRGKDFPLCW